MANVGLLLCLGARGVEGNSVVGCLAWRLLIQSVCNEYSCFWCIRPWGICAGFVIAGIRARGRALMRGDGASPHPLSLTPDCSSLPSLTAYPHPAEVVPTQGILFLFLTYYGNFLAFYERIKAILYPVSTILYILPILVHLAISPICLEYFIFCFLLYFFFKLLFI